MHNIVYYGSTISFGASFVQIPANWPMTKSTLKGLDCQSLTCEILNNLFAAVWLSLCSKVIVKIPPSWSKAQICISRRAQLLLWCCTAANVHNVSHGSAMHPSMLPVCTCKGSGIAYNQLGPGMNLDLKMKLVAHFRTSPLRRPLTSFASVSHVCIV